MGGVQRNVNFECQLCICSRTKASSEKLWVGLFQYLRVACWLLGNGPAFTSTKPGGSPYTCICFIFKVVQTCCTQPSLIVRLDE
jgi:hypothetical protein